MATLHIWETVRAGKGIPVIRLDDRTTHQSVDFTAGVTQSAPFDADTSIISIKADVACAVMVGVNPTATADGFPIAVDTLYDFEVEPGLKLSVIAA